MSPHGLLMRDCLLFNAYDHDGSHCIVWRACQQTALLDEIRQALA